MRIHVLLPVFLVLLASGACGGGGGGGDAPQGPPPDLSGWWLEEADDLATPEGYYESRLVLLADDGVTVTYDRRSLQKEGWALHYVSPDAGSPDRLTYELAIVRPDLVEGQVEQLRDGARDWAHRRRLTPTTPPDGRLGVNGTIAGLSVAVDSSTAYAIEYDDDGIWTSLYIQDVGADETTLLWLTLETTPHIPAGTYDVGGAGDEISVIAWQGGSSDHGVSGNVVLTQSTPSRAAGWYIVTLAGGGSVSGSFDVPIRISTPWPD